MQRLFFAAVCGVFWLRHGPLMSAGGHGRIAFARAARRQLRIALRIMDPRRYRFRASDTAGAMAAPQEQQRRACDATGVAMPDAPSDDPDFSGKWLEL
jgi:hypothetical protein